MDLPPGSTIAHKCRRTSRPHNMGSPPSMLNAGVVGVRLPESMLENLVRHVIACGRRLVNYEMAAAEFEDVVMEDGKPRRTSEEVRFHWYPWCVGCAALWLKRPQTAGTPEQVLTARRTLSRLVVELGVVAGGGTRTLSTPSSQRILDDPRRRRRSLAKLCFDRAPPSWSLKVTRLSLISVWGMRNHLGAPIDRAHDGQDIPLLSARGSGCDGRPDLRPCSCPLRQRRRPHGHR